MSKATRILCIVLAALMLFGTVFSLVASCAG